MPNPERECSEFVYDLSQQQLEALLTIAQQREEPFLAVVMEAIDQYIEREKKTWQ